jgi:hypothetical protein
MLDNSSKFGGKLQGLHPVFHVGVGLEQPSVVESGATFDTRRHVTDTSLYCACVFWPEVEILAGDWSESVNGVIGVKDAIWSSNVLLANTPIFPSVVV